MVKRKEGTRCGVPQIDVPVRVESRIFSDLVVDCYRSGRLVFIELWLGGESQGGVPGSK